MLDVTDVVPLVEWTLLQAGPLNVERLKEMTRSTPEWAPHFDAMRNSSRLVTLAMEEACNSKGSIFWDATCSAWAIAPGSPLPTEPPEVPRQVEGCPRIGRGQGCVYAVYSPTDRYTAATHGETRWPIKIGRTSRPPERRMAELQIGSRLPLTLGLVLLCDEPAAAEASVHRQLAPRRLEGRTSEWFSCSLLEVRRVFEASTES